MEEGHTFLKVIHGRRYVYRQIDDVIVEDGRSRGSLPFYERTQVSEPVDLCVELTTWCNWTCGNCFSRSARGRKGIHADPEAVARYIQSHEKELIRVTITGGEPLLHPEIEQLLTLPSIVPNCGFVLSTNGSVREDVDGILIEQGWLVAVSLHGMAESHSKYSQSASFDASVRRVRRLAKDTVVHIYAVVHNGLSERDVDALLELREETGAAFLRFIAPRPFGRYEPMRARHVLDYVEDRVGEHVGLKVSPSRTRFLSVSGDLRMSN